MRKITMIFPVKRQKPKDFNGRGNKAGFKAGPFKPWLNGESYIRIFVRIPGQRFLSSGQSRWSPGRPFYSVRSNLLQWSLYANDSEKKEGVLERVMCGVTMAERKGVICPAGTPAVVEKLRTKCPIKADNLWTPHSFSWMISLGLHFSISVTGQGIVRPALLMLSDNMTITFL